MFFFNILFNLVNIYEDFKTLTSMMTEVPSTSSNATSQELKYEQTLMYGTYRSNLGNYAKDAAAHLREQSLRVRQERLPLNASQSPSKKTKLKACCMAFKKSFMYHIGSDWVFLLLLGIIMAMLSFAMDYSIRACQKAHYYLYRELTGYVALQYLTWVLFPLLFIIFSVGFVHTVSPQAIGSGIPEMKTILRGVVLKEYLTFRVLVAKMIGLVASVGSRLPIGKEGPFVHIASIVATLLNKFYIKIKAPLRTSAQTNEMLAAACAVGVACNFAAPIGGVLFSIEVTSTFFAVRDYWRGFFGAVCGAFVFRLLAVFNQDEETITALFKTNLRVDFPFDLQEFLGFIIIGILCGFVGALFVYLHKQIVEFHRKNDLVNNCMKKSRFIYPAIVTIIIASLKFPGGLGQYMAGDLTLKEAVDTLFDNKTWNKLAFVDDSDVLMDMQEGWKHPSVNIFVTLSTFIILNFIMTAFAITLPVPSGIFMPIFVIGAAIGRLVGETMSVVYPNGFLSEDHLYYIVPGGYAVVGAASLSGAVTHTISTSVIVFELTGQISHILPVMIAVLISNAIAQRLQPSIYDSIIDIKELPFLPDITAGKQKYFDVCVDDFMIRSVKFITLTTTYRQLKSTLSHCEAKVLPLVNSVGDMVLIGSISRAELETLLNEFVCEWPTDTSDGSPHHGSRDVLQMNSMKKDFKNTHSAEADLKDMTVETSLIEPVKNKGVDAALQNHDSDLDVVLEFSRCAIDQAPFQLVERTSLHMVHSMFSLLGINVAFVTSVGRLVGVVSIRELRDAIEGVSIRNRNNKRQKKQKTKIRKSVKYGTKTEEATFLRLEQEPDDDVSDVDNQEH